MRRRLTLTLAILASFVGCGGLDDRHDARMQTDLSSLVGASETGASRFDSPSESRSDSTIDTQGSEATPAPDVPALDAQTDLLADVPTPVDGRTPAGDADAQRLDGSGGTAGFVDSGSDSRTNDVGRADATTLDGAVGPSSVGGSGGAAGSGGSSSVPSGSGGQGGSAQDIALGTGGSVPPSSEQGGSIAGSGGSGGASASGGSAEGSGGAGGAGGVDGGTGLDGSIDVEPDGTSDQADEVMDTEAALADAALSTDATGPSVDTEQETGGAICTGPIPVLAFANTNGAVETDPANLDLGTEYTLEAWIYPSVENASGRVFTKWVQSAEDKSLYLSDGFVRVTVFGSAAGGDVSLQGSYPLAGGSWHHVAVSVGGGTARLFVDGIDDVDSPVIPAAPANQSSPIWLGSAFRDGAQQPGLQGYISDVRVSSIARYTTSFLPELGLAADVNTLALWHISDGAPATTVADNGPQSLTGAIGELSTWAWTAAPARCANHPPTVAGQLFGNVQDQSTTTTGGTLLANDLDGDSVTFARENNAHGTYGVLALGSGGIWTYTLDDSAAVHAISQGQTQTDSFLVWATDSRGGRSTAAIGVFVAGATVGGP